MYPFTLTLNPKPMRIVQGSLEGFTRHLPPTHQLVISDVAMQYAICIHIYIWSPPMIHACPVRVERERERERGKRERGREREREGYRWKYARWQEFRWERAGLLPEVKFGASRGLSKGVCGFGPFALYLGGNPNPKP